MHSVTVSAKQQSERYLAVYSSVDVVAGLRCAQRTQFDRQQPLTYSFTGRYCSFEVSLNTHACCIDFAQPSTIGNQHASVSVNSYTRNR